MEANGVTYVILGFLGLGRPRSGYEIKQMVDNSTRFFWAASYGQLYPELRRLAAAGLIEGESAPSGGRRRIVYRLTAAGERALREWLVSPLSSHELRDEALLKLFFADALEPEERIGIARAMRGYHEEALERLREIEPRARAGKARFPYVVLERGLALHELGARWAADLERLLEKEAKRKG